MYILYLCICNNYHSRDNFKAPNTIVKRNIGQLHDGKANNQQLSVLFTSNADGTEKLKLMVIHTAAYPVAF